LIAALSLECATVLRQTHWVGQRMEDAARQALSIGISLNGPATIRYALTALAEVAAVRPGFALFRETNWDLLRLELCMADPLDTKFMLTAGRELRPLPDGVDQSVLECLSAVDGITLDDDAALLQLAEEVLGHSARRGRSPGISRPPCWRGLGRMRRAGESEAARAFWERGRAMLACGIFEQIHVSVPHLLAVSAHVAAAIGLPDEGLIDIDRSLALVAQTGEAHSESELYRAKGEIVLAMGDSISGERNFRVARAIARRQSAKGLELRAAISLARLLLQQRRSDEAYDILTPVHDWFQQGFDEPIMRQVQSLRDALDRARGARLPPTVLAASA
jgi:hypothetical protein